MEKLIEEKPILKKKLLLEIRKKGQDFFLNNKFNQNGVINMALIHLLNTVTAEEDKEDLFKFLSRNLEDYYIKNNLDIWRRIE